jgi:uncharacterized membrane protein
MTNKNHRFTGALVVALLFVPLFAGLTSATEFGPNPTQKAAIESQLGATFPKGNWETFRETTTFYLHTTAARGPQADRALGGGTNGYLAQQTDAGAHLWLDTQLPTIRRVSSGTGGTYNNDQALIVGPGAGAHATFNFMGWHPSNVQPKLGAFDNLSIYDIDFAIYADTSPTGAAADRNLIAIVWVQNQSTGARIDSDPVTTGVQPLATITLREQANTGGTTRVCPGVTIGGECPAVGTAETTNAYTGRAVFDQLDGFKIPRDHLLSFDIGTNGPGPWTIHMGTWGDNPSNIRINSDSARVNWWTEDRFGKVTDTFPRGLKDQTEDTRIRFKLVHANMWGNEDCTGDNGRQFDCTYDGIDQRQFQIRFRDMTSNKLMPLDVGRGLVGADPGQDNLTAACCNNDFRLIKYTNVNKNGQAGVAYFEYTIAYNQTFPNGPYRVEFRDTAPSGVRWQGSQLVYIGGEGFILEPSEVEKKVQNVVYARDNLDRVILPLQLIEVKHVVGVNERTDFRLTLTNNGTTTDTIGLSVPVPGHGWTATVHPTLVSLPAGQSQEVRVAVTPPSSGLAGDWKAVNVVASSLRSDDTMHVRLNTTLTGAQTWGVLLLSAAGIVEVNPTIPVRFPATVINNGTFEDTFVITAEGVPTGWSVQIDPPFVSAYAKSAQDFVITVIAPPEVKGGIDDWVMKLRATRIADSAIFSELLVPVHVIVRDGVEVKPYQPAVAWRDIGNPYDDRLCVVVTCVPGAGGISRDRTYDDATVFRMQVRNLGPREDTFVMSASWVPGGDGACDATGPAPGNNGVPDGWRFRIIPTPAVTNPIISTFPAGAQTSNTVPGNPDGGATTTFSGDMKLAEITMDAFETREVYVEIRWVIPTPTSGNVACTQANVAANAALRLTTRSTNDPTLIDVDTLTATLTNLNVAVDRGGRHPNSANDVRIMEQLFQPRVEVIPEGSVGYYDLRAMNTGNEVDDLRIIITEEVPGWTHTFDSWSFIPSTVTSNPEVPYNRACTLITAHELRCDDVGVFDEVHFRVSAKPPTGARIGDRDLIKVGVSGGFGGAGSVSDTIRMEGIVGGPYLFELEHLNQVLKVSPENIAAFPFSIHNVGLSPDTYELKILGNSSTTLWNARLSSGVLVGVPAGKSHHGFLSIVAPEEDIVEAGSTMRFDVQVRSIEGGKQFGTLSFLVEVMDPTPDLILQSTPTTLLQGQVGEFRIKALSESAKKAEFRIDPQTLPRGWTLVCQQVGSQMMPAGCVAPFSDPTRDIRNFEAATPFKIAEARFFVQVPPGELTTSRVAVRVAVNTTSETQYHDVELNLASLYGVKIDTTPVRAQDGGNIGTVAPAQSYVHNLLVTNTGLTPSSIKLKTTAMPRAWNVTLDQSTMYLLPGMSRAFNVTMSAPQIAPTGAEAVIRVFATPANDTSKEASVELITRIGKYNLLAEGFEDVVYIAPEEPANFQVAVTNTGTVKDNIGLTMVLPSAYKGTTVVSFQTGTCDTVVAGPDNDPQCRFGSVEPGGTRVANVEVKFGGAVLPPGTKVPVVATAKSLLAPVGSPGAGFPPEPAVISTYTMRAEMLNYRGMDIDGDGLIEYAVDRNRDRTDGMEQFMESRAEGAVNAGVRSVAPDLSKFLTVDATKRKTIEVTVEGEKVKILDTRIDGDDDGFMDHFLDTNADGLPDLYWDPDLGHVTRLNVTRDISMPPNGVAEYFIDLDGDGVLDKFYDLNEGRFGKLFQTFANSDKYVDYIVDANFNGKADDGEPILFGGPGGITASLRLIDVDGDKRLDEVYETNDRSKCPSGMYFVPAGGNRNKDQFCIRHKDMNKDGTVDWLYDANRDGREDSWYDPVAKKTHLIDSRSDFVQNVGRFWYIALIFGLVLVLFVVLVAVTRR